MIKLNDFIKNDEIMLRHRDVGEKKATSSIQSR